MSTTVQRSSASASTTASSTQQQQPIIVSGEASDSVTVQSQLATSVVAGDVKSHSNITQVVQDLGAAHSANSGWVEAETTKISQWGQREIEGILNRTKGMETELIKVAKQRQLELDAKHQAQLAKMVKDLDLVKATQLKEIEDGLQRQIQAALSNSKSEINRIESEMNTRKMEVLKQAQVKSAKEIDSLSNLVVSTKLVPSTVRTVIDTKTDTGSVLAVATGGTISTGACASESVTSATIAAIPNAGEVSQQVQVSTGDMVKNSTGEKVGEGAIVSTMTSVREQGTTNNNLNSNVNSTSTSNSGINNRDSGLASDRTQLHGATQRPGQAVPVDEGRESGSRAGAITAGTNVHDGDKSAYNKSTSDNTRQVDAAYGKHEGTGSGLMNKVRSVLGGEPKSSDATARRT